MRLPLKALLFLSLLIFFSWTMAGTGYKETAPHIPLHVDLEWSSTYDGNLFRLSERDLHRFESGTEPYPSPYSTWDDWRNDFGITVALPWEHSNGWETRLQGSFKTAIHSINHRKDYQRYAADLRQTFGQLIWAEGSFAIVPSYYIREYLDRDLDLRTGCDYESRTFGVKLRYRTPWRTYLYPFYQFKSLYYSRHFTEFDSEWTTIGISAEQYLTRRWLVGGSYRFTMSDNVGGGGLTAASQVNPMEDSEYGDGDFEEDEFRLSLTYKPRRLLGTRWEFSTAGKLRIRNYTTDNSLEADPFHAGRKDTRWEVGPTASLRIIPSLWLSANFLYEQRDTDSDVGYVREFKDFVRRAYSIGLEYQLLPLPKKR
ncbi:hypothetical protein AMJ86_05320 [bacterium SM23_57]|nr:MAG: hypothetical protein AMJ86_05320 [bacterium SM23_57]